MHRYRLGANHLQLPVNQPHAAAARHYNRDGAMRSDGNYGREKNYEPNSFGGRYRPGNRCGREAKSPGSSEITLLSIAAMATICPGRRSLPADERSGKAEFDREQRLEPREG